jgi:hypothetical protein
MTQPQDCQILNSTHPTNILYKIHKSYDDMASSLLSGETVTEYLLCERKSRQLK